MSLARLGFAGPRPCRGTSSELSDLDLARATFPARSVHHWISILCGVSGEASCGVRRETNGVKVNRTLFRAASPLVDDTLGGAE